VTGAHDAVEFARAIEKVATDTALRQRMGAHARESVVHRSWPNAFQKFWATTAG
jgi:glycosyltransferase involved in cell wall biosynthesis